MKRKCTLVTLVTVFCLNVFTSYAQPGGALNFDGVDDYGFIPSSPTLTNQTAFTMEAWILPDKSKWTQTVMGRESAFTALTVGTPDGWQDVAVTLYSWFAAAPEQQVLVLPFPQDNQWHHIAVTCESSVVQIYLDGVLSGATMMMDNPMLASDDTYVLGYTNFSSSNYKGSIDEVRIWNRVLTSEEIEGGKDAELSSTPEDLVSYLKFNQGVAGGDNSTITTLDDASLYNNYAKIFNFTSAGSSSNFVPGYLNGSTTTLSVTFVQFSASTTTNKVVVKWSTAQESNIDHFTVLRSTNGKDWVGISQVKPTGKPGINQYQFTDPQPNAGVVYYRIAETAIDGKVSYSAIIRLSSRTSLGSLSIHPNPVRGNSFMLNLNQNVGGGVSYTIHTISGKKVATGWVTQTQQNISLNNLAPGLYVLTTSMGQSIKFEK